jgi:hypothetical protein
MHNAKVGRWLYSLAGGQLVKGYPFQTRQGVSVPDAGRRPDWAGLPSARSGSFMRTPGLVPVTAWGGGPACDAVIGELLAVSALVRLRLSGSPALRRSSSLAGPARDRRHRSCRPDGEALAGYLTAGKANLQRGMRAPAGMTPGTGTASCPGMNRETGRLRDAEPRQPRGMESGAARSSTVMLISGSVFIPALGESLVTRGRVPQHTLAHRAAAV